LENKATSNKKRNCALIRDAVRGAPDNSHLLRYRTYEAVK